MIFGLFPNRRCTVFCNPVSQAGRLLAERIHSFLHELPFLRILPISTVDIPVELQYTLLVVGVEDDEVSSTLEDVSSTDEVVSSTVVDVSSTLEVVSSSDDVVSSTLEVVSSTVVVVGSSVLHVPGSFAPTSVPQPVTV